MSASAIETAPALRTGRGPAAGRAARGHCRSGASRCAALALALSLAAWHLAATYRLDLGVVTFRNVPTPTAAAQAAWALLHAPALPTHLAASLARVLSGFLAALGVGVVLGLAIGRSKRAHDLLLPPLEVLRPIPAVAWIPLAILMFPSSEVSMAFITFTGALFPILLNTVHGVESVHPRLVAALAASGRGMPRSCGR